MEIITIGLSDILAAEGDIERAVNESLQLCRKVRHIQDYKIWIDCPGATDALEYPGMVSLMAQAIVVYPGVDCDKAEWASLTRKIKAAAVALEFIHFE